MNGEMIAVLMVGLLRECLGFSGLLAYPKTSLVRYMRKTRQEMKLLKSQLGDTVYT